MKKVNLSFASAKNWLSRTGGIVKKVPWILGMHAFLCIMICFILAVCLGEFLFYNDVYLAKVEDPAALVLPVRFNEQTYQSVVGEWQTRQTLFDQASEQNYVNPFNK